MTVIPVLTYIIIMSSQDSFPFVFLILPFIAIIIAIVKRNTYWIIAILIAILSLPLQISMYKNQATCQAEFCGLGDWFIAIIGTVILGIVAISISLIKAPQVIKADKDKKKVVSRSD